MSLSHLVGKVALVTGASSGLGYDISKNLVKEGLVVVGIARRADKLQKLKDEATGPGQFYSKICDVTNINDLQQLFDWIESTVGGVDVLINNAGVGSSKGIEDIEISEWKKTLDTNVLALAVCTKYALKSMRKRGDNGNIININSIAGHEISRYMTAPIVTVKVSMYTASKHAVTAFTKCIKEELRSLNSGLRITSISPGLVSSEMTQELIVSGNSLYLSPQDISDAVLFVLRRPQGVQITELTIVPAEIKK